MPKRKVDRTTVVTFLQRRYPLRFLGDQHLEEDTLFPMERYIVFFYIHDLLSGTGKDGRYKAEHTFAFGVGTTISS